VQRRDLSERGARRIVRTEIVERQSAAADYERVGRHDDAARLQAEAAILESHLNGS
jgi:uncharacterized protein YqeY